MMTHAHSAPGEAVWPALREQALQIKAKEPLLASFVQDVILGEKNILSAMAKVLSLHLASAAVSAQELNALFISIYQAQPELEKSVHRDLFCVEQSDPAARDFITPFLFFKGFHSLQTHRHAHWLWQNGRQALALHLQNRVSEQFGVDIHPAAVIGDGIMMDHATGIVIGETAIVENDVMMWHNVTLGTRSLTAIGHRHPTIRQGAILSLGCSIIGTIEVGAGAVVAAGSVVLDNVPPGVTVAGVPARIVG